MKINGELDLSGCNNLISINKITEINGGLILSNTKVSNISKNIKFNWRSYLDISETLIEDVSFLKNKTLKYINLFGLKIKQLPSGLETLMELRVNECKLLKQLPKDIKIGGVLYLKNSGITKEYMKKNFPEILCDWLF
jgi:hypothetical protein